jgi:hypothetical protein
MRNRYFTTLPKTQENLTKLNGNFTEAFFVDNGHFTYGGENVRKFDEEFFGSGFFLTQIQAR